MQYRDRLLTSSIQPIKWCKLRRTLRYARTGARLTFSPRLPRRFISIGCHCPNIKRLSRSQPAMEASISYCTLSSPKTALAMDPGRIALALNACLLAFQVRGSYCRLRVQAGKSEYDHMSPSHLTDRSLMSSHSPWPPPPARQSNY